MSIAIPDGVTRISHSVFKDCSLTSITIPDGATIIDHKAFESCTGLKSIVIPNSVTSIGSSTFEMCTHLTRITFRGTVTQWNAIVKGYDWHTYNGSYTIYCTDGTITKDGTVTYN